MSAEICLCAGNSNVVFPEPSQCLEWRSYDRAVALARLFQPFFRSDVRPNAQGLGLGLHIASEIAKAHGGALGVISNADETRFTFRMPWA